jgi:hypothetical protein
VHRGLQLRLAANNEAKRPMQKVALFWLLVILYTTAWASSSTTPQVSSSESVLFLSLDERFTTRNAFLNLAQLTQWSILTPTAPNMLPSHKIPPDLDALSQWFQQQLPATSAAILSSEMYLYGGLIASRTSNDTQEVSNHQNYYENELPTSKCLKPCLFFLLAGDRETSECVVRRQEAISSNQILSLCGRNAYSSLQWRF